MQGSPMRPGSQHINEEVTGRLVDEGSIEMVTCVDFGTDEVHVYPLGSRHRFI
jgi:hypothetical protein